MGASTVASSGQPGVGSGLQAEASERLDRSLLHQICVMLPVCKLQEPDGLLELPPTLPRFRHSQHVGVLLTDRSGQVGLDLRWGSFVF